MNVRPRTRSRSPHSSTTHARTRTDNRSQHPSHRPHKRRRTTSPSPSPSPRHHHRHRHHHHHHSSSHTHNHKQKHTSPPSPDHPITLPSSASRLSKHHLPTYTPLFARYLDIQKQRYIEDMDETEVKGRWKRFVEHWNRGQLASGWYDPDTKRRADEEEAAAAAAAEVEAGAEGKMEDAEGEEEEEGTFGPTPAPRPTSGRRGARPPTLNDLALRDEETSASLLKSRKAAHRASAALEKSRLADLLPPSSSEPGSKAHQLEKKRLAASTAATFRASKPQAGELQDVGDAELGFQDEGVGVKGMKMQEERRRSEREIKREEIRLARKAEWEERMAVVREREERSMEGLKRLARERFG